MQGATTYGPDPRCRAIGVVCRPGLAVASFDEAFSHRCAGGNG